MFVEALGSIRGIWTVVLFWTSKQWHFVWGLRLFKLTAFNLPKLFLLNILASNAGTEYFCKRSESKLNSSSINVIIFNAVRVSYFSFV